MNDSRLLGKVVSTFARNRQRVLVPVTRSSMKRTESRTFVARAAAFAALITAACTAEKTPEQVVVPLMEERLQAPVDRQLLEVRIDPPAVTKDDHHGAELAGLVTALLESGLSDLEDVIPRVKGSTVSPGLTPTIRSNISRWTVDLQVAEGLSPQDISLEALFCSAEHICAMLDSTGSRTHPEAAVAELLGAASQLLGRFPFVGTSTAWSQPQSDDTYAVLLAGRAAATFYGLLPATPPEVIGDRRRDPVERALFVDPDMPVASWIAGRRRIALNLPVLAHAAFQHASELRPSSRLFAADMARALSLAGEHEDALAAWARVSGRDVNDPRFTLGRAQALLSAGQADFALTKLDTLPITYRNDPSAVALRVSIEDALGDSRDREDLLVLWQEVAANDPEPVRRRIARRVDQRNYPEALELVDELARRGAREEAARIGVALALGTHDFERAEGELLALRWTNELAHLRARIAFEQDPTTHVPQLVNDQDPLAIVFAANAYAARGQLQIALTEVDRALSLEPYMAEALSLRYQVLAVLGRRAEAESALALLASADPYYPKPAPLAPVAPPPAASASGPQGPRPTFGRTGTTAR